jgi:Transglutaminase-like superfamily/SH3 domain
MDLIAPPLPQKFPCWVRAVYSWGGETKRDLGFLEGDLIECLNAGDGCWWTGRLRRDPRKVGSFPSNFVEVLDKSFQPSSSRCPSPLPPSQPSPNPAIDNSRSHKSFRKPFQSYNKSKPSSKGSDSPNGSQRMRKPFSSMAQKPDIHSAFGSQKSTTNDRPASQLASPLPRGFGASRPVSPNIPRPYSRGIAAAPMSPYTVGDQEQSFHPQEASPPPAPPPHRYNPSRAPSPQPMHNDDYRSIARTPEPIIGGAPSPVVKQPSPFTEALTDIMNTFNDMGLRGDEGQDQDQDQEFEVEPTSVWGPDDYEKFNTVAKTQRPHTVMAAPSQPDSGYGTGFDVDSDQSHGEQAQLDDYIPRMERRLRELQESGWKQRDSQEEDPELRPPIPAKNSDYDLRGQLNRPRSAFGIRKGSSRLKKQKSAYELGRDVLNRALTIKTSITTTTNSSSVTDRSIMSGAAISEFSAKSAGSFYRRKLMGGKDGQARPMSSIDFTKPGGGVSFSNDRPQTSMTHISFQQPNESNVDLSGSSLYGGLTTPSPKKRGFMTRFMDSARASAATARSTLATSSRPSSPQKMTAMTGIAGGTAVQSRPQSSAAKDMGLGGVDWVQVRRDLYRSNSLSRNERQERLERCQMLDIPVIAPVEELLQCIEGGEGLDGLPVSEPVDFSSCNLSLVDKSARFVNNLPPSTTPAGLVQGYLCRPYRSDVQRLRAIFTWVSERISWEEDFEGNMNIRRVMQSKRGCTEEIAHLVVEMCTAVGVHAELIHGHLKVPGEPLDIDLLSRPNHWWNSVIVDGEWRIMDCSLANPTNPKRAQYSTIRSQGAETYWFLTNPLEACYTHVPLMPEHQHLVPPASNEVLLSLPCVCPAYFQNHIEIHDFDASLLHLDNLELAHLQFYVPEDVECVAEVEVRAYARDADGDLFENGDVVRKPALAQVEWFAGRKKFTIKALLPSDEGQGVLKIYSGKRGLMVCYTPSAISPT